MARASRATARKAVDLIEAGSRARAARFALARTNVNVFIEETIRHETKAGADGRRAFVRQNWMHQEWQRLLDQHRKVVIFGHIHAGKSWGGVGRVLHTLGEDPNKRGLILSDAFGGAVKLGRAVRQYIEISPELHQIFPNLVPSTAVGDPWGERDFTVARTAITKDPSVQCRGIAADDIQGSLLDWLLVDDLLNWDNCHTDERRRDMLARFKSKILTRLAPNAWVLFFCNSFHREDTAHMLEREGWVAQRYPVRHPARYPTTTDTGAAHPHANEPHPHAGESVDPIEWPEERIRAEEKLLGPFEAPRMLYCLTRDDSTAKFKDAWIDACLARGADKTLTASLDYVPGGWRTYTGVDLAVGQKETNDETCLFTIAVSPFEDREVLDIIAGRFDANEILRLLAQVHARYHSILVVESNAAQDYLRQFAGRRSALPILPYNTGKEKTSPEFGIETMAVEMANEKWIIPSKGGVTGEVARWITEMREYAPGPHTGDRLMASWLATRGPRIVTGPIGRARRFSKDFTAR